MESRTKRSNGDVGRRYQDDQRDDYRGSYETYADRRTMDERDYGRGRRNFSNLGRSSRGESDISQSPMGRFEQKENRRTARSNGHSH